MYASTDSFYIGKPTPPYEAGQARLFTKGKTRVAMSSYIGSVEKNVIEGQEGC